MVQFPSIRPIRGEYREGIAKTAREASRKASRRRGVTEIDAGSVCAEGYTVLHNGWREKLMDNHITTEDSEAGSPDTRRPAWSLGFKAFLVIAALALAGGSMFMAQFVSLNEVSTQGMLVAGLGGALVVPYLCLYARLIWRSTLADLDDDATLLSWVRRLRAWRFGIVVIWALVALPVAVPFVRSRILTSYPEAVVGDTINAVCLAVEISLGIGFIIAVAVGAAGYGVSTSALRHIRSRVPRTVPEGEKLQPGQANSYLPEQVAALRTRVGTDARLSFSFTWNEPLDLEGNASKSKSAKRRRKRQGTSATGNPRADAMAEIAQSASVSHLRLFAYCFVAFIVWVAAYITLGIVFGFLE